VKYCYGCGSGGMSVCCEDRDGYICSMCCHPDGPHLRADRAALVGKLATQQLQLGPNSAETRDLANKQAE